MDNIHRLTSAQDIEQQAADWLVRLDSDRPLSQDELQQLKSWMQTSPAHREQLQRLTKYWHRANQLAELSFPLPGSPRPDGLTANMRYQFRQLFTSARQATVTLSAVFTLCMAVAIGLLINSGDSSSVSGNGIYQTRIGEQNTITLSDGSVIQLNTNSRLQVNYVDQLRQVVLMAGEAHFDVAKEPDRPFLVKAGEGMVQAVGTAFSVRLNPEALRVTVTEGKVALISSATELAATPSSQSQPQPAPQQQTRGYLVQGQSVDFKPAQQDGLGSQVHQLQPLDLEHELAWRQGLLLFSGESLKDVIEEVNRYTKLDIQIIDSEIADISIGGQFKVGETEAMLKVLETSFGIDVTRPSANTVHLALK